MHPQKCDQGSTLAASSDSYDAKYRFDGGFLALKYDTHISSGYVTGKGAVGEMRTGGNRELCDFGDTMKDYLSLCCSH